MHASCPPATATLVQSIPVGDFSVKAATGTIPTWLALVALANCSTTSLDFTAMYMDLLGTEDRQQFSPSEMTDFGADRGYAVFDAVRAAARRGVKIRILLGTLNDPLNSTEVQSLLQFPSVAARSWDPDPWYGGGIMHMKLWVSDGAAMYTGSANADWKSLAQVKEVGVTLADATVAGDAQKVYETFWQWADPARVPTNVTAWSDDYQATLTCRRGTRRCRAPRAHPRRLRRRRRRTTRRTRCRCPAATARRTSPRRRAARSCRAARATSTRSWGRSAARARRCRSP